MYHVFLLNYNTMKLTSPAFFFAFLLSLFLFTPTSASAASKGKKATWKKDFKQNDFQIGYGYLSCIKIVDALGDVEMSDVTQADVETQNRKTIGAITAQFTHRNRRGVSFGIALSYEQTKEDCILSFNKNVSTKVGELTNRYISATPLLRFNWFDCCGKVLFYSKLAAGITFIGDKYTNMSETRYDVKSQKQHYFAYQVSPLGFALGTRPFGVFIEGGFGTHGVVQAGLTYRF